jgi:glycosyl hydrolase family 42 (putative beta-galactosidase)/putative glycosyl hydrolase
VYRSISITASTRAGVPLVKSYGKSKMKEHKKIRQYLTYFIFIAFTATAPCIYAQKQEVIDLLSKSVQSSQHWTFSNGGEFPGAKGDMTIDTDGLLYLKFDFTGGGAYVAAYRNLTPPDIVKKVSLKIKKPPQTQITVRIVDSKDQTFQKSVIFEKSRWQKIEFQLRGWAAHFGGPNDGIVRQPIKRIGIIAESGARNDIGEILITDLVYEKGNQQDLKQALSQVHTGEYVVSSFDENSGFTASGPSNLSNGKWTVDFVRTDSSGLYHSLSLFSRPEKLILKIDSQTEGHLLRIRLGSHFQAFEKTIGRLKAGSQKFTIPMPPDGWKHYGGENDGKVRCPLRLTALMLDRSEGPKEKNTIKIEQLTCITKVPADQAVTLSGSLEEVREIGSKRLLKAKTTSWNLLDKILHGDLIITVRDWQKEVLYERTIGLTLPANGVETQWSRTVTIPADLNFAEAEFRFDSETQQTAKTLATYTKLPSDPGDAKLNPESPWGMGVYLYRYPDNAVGYERMDKAAAMAQAAGVKWSREEFSWNRIEIQPGKYDFHYYDKVVETATNHGISIYGLLAYWSRWTEPYTEQGIDDFCKWARAVVRHYKGKIKHWEIYNEPNIFFWSGPRELYPTLVKKCYMAIKEEDPEAQVLAISTAGIDRKFIQLCLDADSPFDILTIHPYRSLLSERAFMEELVSTAKLVDNRPVWITEMGWSTQIGGTDERTQAQLLARSYLSSVASGACQNVSWYNFRCDGNDLFYNEHNFGVLRTDLSPKPGYRSLTTVCRTLSHGSPIRRTDFGSNVYALQVADAVALCAATNAVDIKLKKSGVQQILNLMGEQLPLIGGHTDINLTLKPGYPVFVLGRVEPIGQAVLSDNEKFIDVIRF